MQPYYCKYYFTQHTDFEQGVIDLLEQIDSTDTIVRLVFFGLSSGNTKYLNELSVVRRRVNDFFSTLRPVMSFVVQPVLGGCELAVEVHYLKRERVSRFKHKSYNGNDYLIVHTPELRLLMLGGVMGSDINRSIADQSIEAFNAIDAILSLEQVPIRNIVRQWNYIEQITRMDNGVQHYQAFNDARSLFYGKTSWDETGYPAATGIGTECGGVMIDLIAVVPSEGTTVQIVPVDNPMQVPAHDYSQEVLLGEKNNRLTARSTPKFERAKTVGDPVGDSICFVSGTAAIRGELSVAEMDIHQQTVVTLENIAHLISCGNLKRSGFDSELNHRLGNLRIYMKKEDDYTIVSDTIRTIADCDEHIYLMADVCRDELLIEIEGIAAARQVWEQKN